MQGFFGFFLRFFAAFVAAKLILRPFGADTTRWLLLLSALLTINLYWLDLREIRSQVQQWWDRRRLSQNHDLGDGRVYLPPPAEPPESN